MMSLVDTIPFFALNGKMSSFKEHPQWKAVVSIQKKLKTHGFQVLVAGGAVRDLLLKKQANDIDLITDAKPWEVENLFEKTVMVGRQFGVSRVILEGNDIEVATFRRDGPYLDGRRPESVEFSSAREDAKRRDFTINALFYDLENNEIIDYVEGQKDIEMKIIRTVGKPEERFQEDKLRILRALRFHSQLGFDIEEETFKAIKTFASFIHQVSMERIRNEWEKILVSKYLLSCLQKVHESNLWSALFPSWSFCPYDYNGIQGKYEPEKIWILWFLLHRPPSKEQLLKQLKIWKLPRQWIQKTVHCYQSLESLKNIQKWESVDLALLLNQPHGTLALEIYQYLHQRPMKPDFSEKLKKAKSFFHNGHLPKPLVTGNDLIREGFSGPSLAQILKNLYRTQIKEGITEKKTLLTRIE